MARLKAKMLANKLPSLSQDVSTNYTTKNAGHAGTRMKVLVANLGSTSFKYRLFDMPSSSESGQEVQLARGGVERIGSPSSPCSVQIGDYKGELEMEVPHHGIAVRSCISQLTDPENGCLGSADEIAAIGFKAVHGGRIQGVFQIDDTVLDAMDEVCSVAPAHNPPYLAAMRQLAETVPEIPLWRPSKQTFTPQFLRLENATRCPKPGRTHCQFENGAFMVQATGISQLVARKFWDTKMPESSLATSVDPVVCARSSLARAWPQPWD